MWSIGIKTAIFPKISPSDSVYDAYELRKWTQHVFQFRRFHSFNFQFKSCSLFSKILVACQTQATASDFPFYDIFVPQKVPLSKISDGVIACDL